MKAADSLRGLLLAWGWIAGFAVAAPLPVSSLPDPLKSWVPWVMHGNEVVSCPAAHDGAAERACVWPSRLVLDATREGAAFRMEVQVFGASAFVGLPGEPGRWPSELKVDGQPLAGSSRLDRPVAMLSPGSHVVTGNLVWSAVPQDLLLPKETGTLQLSLNGKPVTRTPDADGRVWLQQSQSTAQVVDAATIRAYRLVEDSIPLRVTTHYDLSISGTPREIQLPSALLPGFIAESLESPLPARLHDAGELRLQVRPGHWTVALSGRMMSPAAELKLPADQPGEVWSFLAHNELRLVTVEGVTSVDPKQLPLPSAWASYPAYQIKGGEAFKLVESRRGDPQPGADKLSLNRQIWLDFDGGGYTLQDSISGALSRSWRLEMAAPGVLGRATADGLDQPVTRREGTQLDGVELRRTALGLRADSRLEGASRTLPATGWMADFSQVAGQLHLPPGWRLLHASGVDRADGSWVAQWTLWDFFFVLLSVLATAKLSGRKSAVAVAAALILTWHMPGAPQVLWLVLIGLLALMRVLPAGKLLTTATSAGRICAGLMALLLIPYAVQQIRLSMYPALEYPWMQSAGSPQPNRTAAPALASPADESSGVAANEAAPAAPMKESRVAGKADVLESKAGVASRYGSGRSQNQALDEIDPHAKVQTGPGLPTWRWNSHALTWQGPVQSGQHLNLVLLPPPGTAALRLMGLALLVAALWALARGVMQGASRPPASGAALGSGGVAALLACLMVGALASLPDTAAAVTPPAATQAPKAETTEVSPLAHLPDSALLEAMRAKLTAPPDCLPQCVDIARLRLETQGSRVQLRLEVHALAEVMLPLPGQGAQWRPTLVTVDGKTASTRRADDGSLWMVVRPGVSQVLLQADVGDATNVEIALPLPPREVVAQTEGWTLAGLDARGLASGALSLSRGALGGSSPEAGTQRDALPPFLRVERILRLGLRWTIETRVSRWAPSRAPVRASIALLEGESVNSESVRVEGGRALVQLGAEDSATFVSTLKEAPQLKLASSREPHQLEWWRVDPSAKWHLAWSGIAPVQHVDAGSGRLMPSWQPWPGEAITLTLSKPAGVAGPTLTVDRLLLRLRPGLRSTEVDATATLRSSQGNNHSVTLPAGAEFLGLTLDGQSQPIQPQGRDILIPISPGEHTVKIDWHEPRGMGWMFETSPFGLGVAGVNASAEILLPPERVVLALGGPRVGPVVLIWGVLLTLLVVSIALGRSKITPLGPVSWFLLGLGLAQTSLAGAAAVAGWFFVLAARRRYAPDRQDAGAGRHARVLANMFQLLLVLWTLIAAAFLLNAVRVGLLGYPDMMILGNGSEAGVLRWYQDRFTDAVPAAWAVSAPVLAYRLLMLLWALWLAASMLKWIQWAWQSFSVGGYWFKGERQVRPDSEKDSDF